MASCLVYSALGRELRASCILGKHYQEPFRPLYNEHILFTSCLLLHYTDMLLWLKQHGGREGRRGKDKLL